MFDSSELARSEERDDFEYNDEHIELESDLEEYGPDEEAAPVPPAEPAAAPAVAPAPAQPAPPPPQKKPAKKAAKAAPKKAAPMKAAVKRLQRRRP